jgi:hypothetical protein
LATAAAISARAQKPEIDIPALLAEAKSKSDENWRRMVLNYPNYTFKFRKIWREKDYGNKLSENSELYEIFPPPKCRNKKCRNVTVLIAKNGKPVAAEKIEKERAKAAAKLEQLENDKKAEPFQPNQAPNWMRFGYFIRRPLSGEATVVVRINGQEILEKCEFLAAETEPINGREAISLRFRPRAGTLFAPETNYVPGVEGKIWVDAVDKVFIRLLMWQKASKFEKEPSDYLLGKAAVVYDMTRTKEGIWFFRLTRINGFTNPALFAQMKADFSIENFDHYFFETEIKTVEIDN